MKYVHFRKLFLTLLISLFIGQTQTTNNCKTVFYNDFDIVNDAINNINKLKNKNKNSYFMRVIYKKIDDNTINKKVKTYSRNFHAPSTCQKDIVIHTDASSFNAQEIRFIYKNTDKNHITQKVTGKKRNKQKNVKIALNKNTKEKDNKTLKA